MRLTIVGCAGSYPGPDSPASCYLVEVPQPGQRPYRLLLDLGSGALGPLQQHVDLAEVDAICFSHLHPDHCMDMCGYYVVRRYHPGGELHRIPVHAPVGAADFLAGAYGIEEPEGMTGQFAFTDWAPREPITFGPITVTPVPVDHPVEAYGLRVEAGGRVLAYSGDTGATDSLDELARDADVFLCEASFVESVENPPGVHLTGAEAGAIAARAGVDRLLLTHVPAWTDRAEVLADAKTTWDGACVLVSAGEVHDV